MKSSSNLLGSLLGFSLVAATLAACYSSADVTDGFTGGAGAGGGGGSAGGGGGTVGDGLPCDVAAVLSSKCASCHATGVAVNMATYADLTGPAPSDPTQTLAAVAIARMRSKASPMPPAGSTPATAADIAAFETWVAAGLPTGSCGNDGGAGGNPYDTPTQCTSGTQWNGRSTGSTMAPGQACIDCHSGGEGPLYTIAGTVYPTAHEPDGCNGLPPNLGQAKVVVTDANGAQTALTVNTVGNFASRTNFAKPYHVKVTLGGNERAMSAAPSSGDCNTCHTEQGDQNAPGRIMIP